MRRAAFVLVTTMTVGAVVCVGTSAFAVAVVPGDVAGASQNIESIAAPAQDPAVGAASNLVAGVPIVVELPSVVDLDGTDVQPDPVATDPKITTEPGSAPSAPPAETSPPVVTPASPATPATPAAENSGNGDGDSGHGSSGKDQKAKNAEDDKSED